MGGMMVRSARVWQNLRVGEFDRRVKSGGIELGFELIGAGEESYQDVKRNKEKE